MRPAGAAGCLTFKRYCDFAGSSGRTALGNIARGGNGVLIGIGSIQGITAISIGCYSGIGSLVNDAYNRISGGCFECMV